jgi:hypothetical protein
LMQPLRVLAIVLVLILHVLFALALWYAMKPRLVPVAEVHADADQALIVRFIEPASPPRTAQPAAQATPPRLVPPPQQTTARVRPVTHETPHRDAMVLQDHEPPPAPATSVAKPAAVSVFAGDGSVRIAPTQTTYASTTAKAKPPRGADDRQIMQHDSNRMQYKATRFEKYFPPPNETAGGAVGRHIGDVMKKIAAGMCDPKNPGTATNLLCDAPPLPPSPKDRDERLNLPPPPLADDPHPPKSLPLSTCITDYRADKPLPYGCPVNTPELSFKAEMGECIALFRAGKRLKTWCPRDTAKRAAAESSTPAASSSTGSH